MMRVPKIHLISLFALLAYGMCNAMAQTLVSSADASMSVQDLEADLQRVPPAERAEVFSRPAAVQQNLSGLLVRRVLAAEALKAGLDKDPLVKAALDLARDRVLSEVRLDLIDKAAAPGQQALEVYAESTYNANPKRFALPEKIKIRHILIRSTEASAKAKAEQLLKELKSGADFAELAKSHSQDTANADRGGDLGLVSRGRMVEPFETVAFSLDKPGALSEIVETKFGFHIIRLDERLPASVQSFAEVKDTLVKESLAALTNKARQTEADRILAGAIFDTVAIESYANTQRK